MSGGSAWGRATRKGMVWSSGAFLLAKCSTLLTTLVLARLLAPAQFGVVAAISVFLMFIELGSSIGMKATVVYEQEEGVTRRLQTAFTTNLLVGLALTALGVLLAPAIAGFFRLEGQADLFRLGALNILVVSLGSIHDSLLLRELDFQRRIVPEVSRALIRGVISIALAFAGLEAASLVWGMLAGNLAWTAMQWSLTRFRPDLSLDRAIVRSMVAYGSGAAFLELIGIIASRADAIIIGRVLGERALGLYTVAFRVPETLIDSIAWNLSSVAFPALSRKRAHESEGFAAVALRLVHFQALFALPVAAGLAVLSGPLVVVLFGPEWREAAGVMSAVAVMSGVHAIIFPLGDSFKALGRQRLLSGLSLIQLPLLVGTIIVAAPGGIVLVAWIRAASVVLHTVLVGVAAGPVLGVRWPRVLVAAGPAIACAAGVAAGAGAVRVAWPALAFGPLVAGTAAGAAGGLLALRFLAPGTIGDLLTQARLMRGSSAAEAGAEPEPEPERSVAKT